MATELKYAPLPDEVVTLIRQRIQTLKVNGKPVS
jgi:hypothetical protein